MYKSIHAIWAMEYVTDYCMHPDNSDSTLQYNVTVLSQSVEIRSSTFIFALKRISKSRKQGA